MRFSEERAVVDALINEWYAAMHEVAEIGNKIFSEKAKHYDRISPVWHRIEWPGGFVQELRKKIDRVDQLLQPNGGIDWNEVNEELTDIMMYSNMFHALNLMVERHNAAEAPDRMEDNLAFLAGAGGDR